MGEGERDFKKVEMWDMEKVQRKFSDKPPFRAFAKFLKADNDFYKHAYFALET